MVETVGLVITLSLDKEMVEKNFSIGRLTIEWVAPLTAGLLNIFVLYDRSDDNIGTYRHNLCWLINNLLIYNKFTQ